MARRENWRVQIAGNGTRLGASPTPLGADLVLSTRGLAGVLAFEPGDGTLTAKAGSSMHDLASLAAADGFALTPDVANPTLHTLGGIIGGSVNGIERQALGPMRHHVLGMQVLLADGQLAKTGGRLVKNVTGYDLQRLYSGSRGSLCVILEASMRLFSMPRERRVMRLPSASQAEAIAMAQRVPMEGVAPHAVICHALGADRWQALVLLAGRREGLDVEEQVLRKLWPSSELLDAGAAESARLRWRDALEADPTRPSLVLSCLPSQLSKFAAHWQTALERCGLTPVIFHLPCLASTQLEFKKDTPFAKLLALHNTLIELDVNIHWSHAELGLQQSPFGPCHSAGALMDRFKSSLDPDGLFAGEAFRAQR